MDVDSFVAMLLEITCSTKNDKLSIEDKNQIILVDWACVSTKKGEVCDDCYYSGGSIAKTFHEEHSANVGRCHSRLYVTFQLVQYFSIINYQ